MKRPDIVSVAGKSDKTLELQYSNGEKRIFDVKPYIEGSWFGDVSNGSNPVVVSGKKKCIKALLFLRAVNRLIAISSRISYNY